MMSERWTPGSWRGLPARHMPEDYPDPAALARVEAELARMPPLVFAGEARRLKGLLGEVAQTGLDLRRDVRSNPPQMAALTLLIEDDRIVQQSEIRAIHAARVGHEARDFGLRLPTLLADPVRHPSPLVPELAVIGSPGGGRQDDESEHDRGQRQQGQRRHRNRCCGRRIRPAFRLARSHVLVPVSVHSSPS